MKRGRPCTYTQEVGDEICRRLAEGDTVEAICRDPRMPPASTVRLWAADDRGSEENGAPGFAAAYARARSVGLQKLADELISISDADYTGPDGFVDNAAVQKARLMSDNRKWLLSKMLPKQFGDKVTQEITGEDGGAVITKIELIAIDPPRRPEDLSADGDAVGEVRRFPPRLADRRPG